MFYCGKLDRFAKLSNVISAIWFIGIILQVACITPNPWNVYRYEDTTSPITSSKSSEESILPPPPPPIDVRFCTTQLIICSRTNICYKHTLVREHTVNNQINVLNK